MDKSLLMFRGGVRSIKKKLSDGNEHTLYYKAKTPTEIVLYLGAERRFVDSPESDVAREKLRAEFIANSLCDENGELLFTKEEAMLIPASLKLEICFFIHTGSNDVGDAKKD